MAASPALARGFAVLSSDEGHNGKDPANASSRPRRGAAFGVDPQARDDYGYTGDVTLGPIGKAIIAKFYGVAPARSYMLGCSNGGRHAMVAASRMGEHYDGFVAGDPGFSLPRAAIQHAWDVQSFETIDPDVKKSFSRGRIWRSSPQGAGGLRQARRREGRHRRRHQRVPEKRFVSRTSSARAGRPTSACRRRRSTR